MNYCAHFTLSFLDCPRDGAGHGVRVFPTSINQIKVILYIGMPVEAHLPNEPYQVDSGNQSLYIVSPSEAGQMSL